MKKVRQLLQLMLENQRYKFLMSLKFVVGMKILVEKNIKLEYFEVLIQIKFLFNLNVFRKFIVIEIIRFKKNKKKMLVEKKFVFKYNM